MKFTVSWTVSCRVNTPDLSGVHNRQVESVVSAVNVDRCWKTVLRCVPEHCTLSPAQQYGKDLDRARLIGSAIA